MQGMAKMSARANSGVIAWGGRPRWLSPNGKLWQFWEAVSDGLGPNAEGCSRRKARSRGDT